MDMSKTLVKQGNWYAEANPPTTGYMGFPIHTRTYLFHDFTWNSKPYRIRMTHWHSSNDEFWDVFISERRDANPTSDYAGKWSKELCDYYDCFFHDTQTDALKAKVWDLVDAWMREPAQNGEKAPSAPALHPETAPYYGFGD